ncbi:MAG: fluoride efflux transporter CrcB [Ferruginibacter sp.]
MLKNILLVGAGGAAGSVLRYLISLGVGSREFPYATLTVNIIGSFFIGLFFAYSLRHEVFQNNWKLFLTTGVCGGFTTFSAFSLENLQLLQNGKYFTAIIYIMLSLVICFAVAALGYKLAD